MEWEVMWILVKCLVCVVMICSFSEGELGVF